MRIAYLSADHGVPVLGGKGASVHVQQMVRALSGAGHRVDLFCTRMGEGPQSLPASVTHVMRSRACQDTAEALNGGVLTGEDKRRAKELDLIDTAKSLADTVVAAHRAHPFDLIYERHSLWSAAGIEAGARIGVPVVLEVNARLRDEAIAYRKLVNRDPARTIERVNFSRAHAIIAVSDELRAYIAASGGASARVHVMPNAVDIGAFHPEIAPAATPFDESDVVIGFSGGLKPWHGVQELAKAFAIVARKHANARLMIVGDGPMRPWLTDFLRHESLEHKAQITGWIEHAEIPSLVRRMDIATAPYPQLEAFYFSPLKLFEYMACGCAVVASEIGQIRQVIDHRRNGMLVAPGRVEQLAEAIGALIESPDLRHALGAAARVSVLEHSWDSVGRRIAALGADLTARADRQVQAMGEA